MKKSIAVIGIGRFGFSLAKTLSALKNDVIIIDKNKDAAEKVADYAIRDAICDSTNIGALRDLGIGSIDTAVIAIGNDIHATIMTTINLVELGVKNILVRVDQAEYIPVMTKLGATRVIVPEESSAVSFAHQISSNTFLDYYNIQGEYGIVKIEAPKSIVSRELTDIDARNKFNINVVGIVRNGRFFIPKGTDVFKEGDQLFLIGSQEDLNKFSSSN